MRTISIFLREYTSGWLRFSRPGFSARETEGKTVFSESLTSPCLGPQSCLWASVWVWQVNQCGEGLCSMGLESRWSVHHSQWCWELRESQHGAVCEHLSQRSRPWEFMAGTPGLWTWGCSHVLPGLPTISSSPSLFSTKSSSCSDLDSLGKQLLSWTQGLSPRGRGVFRAVTCVGASEGSVHRGHMQGPHPGECECEICPRCTVTEPGWDPRNPYDQWLRRVCGLCRKHGRQVCPLLWMRWDGLQEMETLPPWPQARGRGWSQHSSPTGTWERKELSVSANMEQELWRKKLWLFLIIIRFFSFFTWM